MQSMVRALGKAALLMGVIALGATHAQAQIKVEAKPAAEVDWTTATELNKVDFSGLSAAQKTEALSLMRSEGCTCGCGMKIAECRVNDQSCPRSPGLAAQIIAGVKAGKSSDDIKKSLTDAKPPTPAAARKPPATLGEAVEIPIKGSPFKGKDDAKITVVEFSDFQCPFCSRFAPWAESMVTAYPNDVKLVFKQFPLPMHKNAKIAAEASLAAADQGKFWEMHDKLFANFRTISRETMKTWAGEIGLDVKKFEKALDDGKFTKAVEDDIAAGSKVGVRGTPSFFINGKKYNGGRTLDAVKPVIEAELKKLNGGSTDAKPQSKPSK